MSTGYSRQSAANIVTGLVVEAAPINAELNQVLAFASETTGHAHDGTMGGGAPLDLTVALKVGTKLPLANGGSAADLSSVPANATVVMNAAGNALTYVKNNYSAIIAPTVSNDSSQGYTPGSTWLDTVGGAVYLCVTNGVGTATWVSLASLASLATVLGKVYNSAADTTAGYVSSKVTVTAPLVRTTNNSGGNENSGLTVNTTSSAQLGVVQLATNAETLALANTAHAVTPSNLGALVSSTSQSGIVTLASNAETLALVNTAHAVTPSNIGALVASTSQKGIVFLASDAEGIAGTDTAKAMTAHSTRASLGNRGLQLQTAKTSGFTAVAGNAYPVDVSSGTFTALLPASATVGDCIDLYIGGTNGVTLGANGLKINGNTSNLFVSTEQTLQLTYHSAGRGWV